MIMPQGASTTNFRPGEETVGGPQDFRKFYDERLRPILDELEVRRKGIVRKVGGAGVLCLLLLAGGGAFVICVLDKRHWLLLPVIVSVVVFMLAYVRLTKDFAREFKDEVIAKIVRFFDESLAYRADGVIPRDRFSAGRIFLHRIDRYRGEDYVSGKIGKTAIEFSEVHAEYKSVSRDSQGRRREYWHTIFRGVFFIADFNKDFNGLTVVLPDVAEKALGRWLGQGLQGMASGRQGELVKLEDPEFEHEFVVYSSDQVEARYILSPALMQRIVAFRRKTGRNIHLSFHHSLLNVAVSTDKNMFEPRIFRSITGFDLCEEYFNDLRLFLDIVDDLDLNTRIWTKK